MVLARDYASITSLNISKWDISVSALRVVLTKFPRLKVLRLPPLCKCQYFSTQWWFGSEDWFSEYFFSRFVARK
jgi:hypothetical protein